MKIQASLFALLLSLLLPTIQAEAPDTSQVQSTVIRADGFDCAPNNETVCWTVEEICFLIRVVWNIIEKSEIPPPCWESAASVSIASLVKHGAITDCPQSYPYEGRTPSAVQHIAECVYLCVGQYHDAGTWYGTCGLVGKGYSPESSTAMLAVVGGETCSNYGIRVVVSVGNTCNNGTCVNEGIQVIVSTGGYCGSGLADACAGNVCIFSGCKPFTPCAPDSEPSLAFQQTIARPCQASYGIVVAAWALGFCVMIVADASGVSPASSESAAIRAIPAGDCELNPSLWNAVVCGKEGEICNIMDSPECWAGRMVCVYLNGPIKEVQDQFPHAPEPFCTTQPGCCFSVAVLAVSAKSYTSLSE